jgi:NADH-quinone oxidoreductase subunit A
MNLLVGQTAPVLPDPRSSWAPVVLLIVMAVIFAASSIIASLIVGPSRSGQVKAGTYESGMVPIGTARRRFNVRFYIVAMIFLVFDVEIVFFYPWATIFAPYAQLGRGQLLLLEMVIFVAILLLAYVYAWGKGVFRWD